MARMRTLKPGFFTNEDLCELPPLARILFAGLWCWADREGRLHDRPRKFQAEILPYNRVAVGDFLDRLAKRGFIVRYRVGDESFIQIVNWKKHQNPHVKEPPSAIPPVPVPDEHGASTVLAPDAPGATHPPSPAGHESWAMGSRPQASEVSTQPDHSLQEETARARGPVAESVRVFAAPKPGETPEAQAQREAIVGWLVGEFHAASPPNAAERERLEMAAGLYYQSRVDVDELPALFAAARDRWSEDAEINPLSVARRVSDLRLAKPAARRTGRRPATDPMEQSRRVALSVLADQNGGNPPRRALA